MADLLVVGNTSIGFYTLNDMAMNKKNGIKIGNVMLNMIHLIKICSDFNQDTIIVSQVKALSLTKFD